MSAAVVPFSRPDVGAAPIPDQAAIRAFFDVFFSWDAPGARVLVAFAQDPQTGENLPPEIEAIADAESATALAFEWTQKRHYNVYVGGVTYAVPPPPGKRGRAEDIEAVTHIVADFDDLDAANYPSRIPWPPSMVLETSPGRFQVYFVFDRPVTAEEAKPLARGLKAFARCDHGTSDIDHVWRVPGCLNWPNAKKVREGRPLTPTVVRGVSPWQGLTVPPAILQMLLPAEAPPPPSGSAMAGEWTTRARPDCAIPEDDDDLLLVWQKCKQRGSFAQKAPPADLLENPNVAIEYYRGDESAADMAFVDFSLYLTGCNCERTERLWLRSERGARDKVQNRPEYVRRTILKALKSFGPDRRVYNQHGAITAAAKTGDVIPKIEVKPGEFHLTVDRAEEALIASDQPLYWRGNRIVKTVAANRPSTDGRRVEVPRIADIQTVHLRELMNHCAAFTKSGGTPMDCPKELAEALAARPESRLPPLKAIITAPLMRPDGSLLDVPGYDQHTGLLFDPMGESFPPVPHAPTRDDARAAVAFVKAPFRAFPFKAPADLSVVLSAILTAIQRPVLSAAPLHAINATVAGSGKGLIVETITTIATGRPPAVMFVPRKDDEFEKSLVGEIVGGSPVIVLDNIEEPVGIPLLCSYLTESIVSVRPLGTSTKRELPTTAMVLATGNNIAFKGDMDRRVVIATIDPACECPENRDFDFNPVEMVTTNRTTYVTAALTVLRAFHVAGRPQQRHPLGSFGEWSRLIRDALIWAGEADPMETVSEVKASNPHRQALGAVIEAWGANLGDQVMTARQVADTARMTFPPNTAELRQALLLVAEDRGEVNPVRLGKWLGKIKGQVIGGRKIITASGRSNTAAWRLVCA